jgi:cytidylate kinase
MPVNPVQIIQALVGAELTAKKSDRYLPQGSVVTVSRSYGSGGDEIAQRLAQRLGVPYYDKQILEAIIAAVPENRAAMERLDQQVSKVRDEVMQAIITGISPTDEYRQHLINVILNIARKSGVIVGRGAHLLLARHHVFRVRIVSSLDQRTMRVAKDRQISTNEAADLIHRADAEATDFFKKVFNESIDDPTRFDLTVNTDHIDLDPATDLILFAMQRVGYPVPQHAAKSH